MNREIKFKCLITDNDKNVVSEFFEWLDGDGWKHSYYLPLVTNGVFDHQELGDGWFGEIIRLQYTGLNGKSQKEIYEGDILKYEWKRGKTKRGTTITDIFWDRTMWSIRKNETVMHDYAAVSCIRFEVIGNIHQHPELLPDSKYDELT